MLRKLFIRSHDGSLRLFRLLAVCLAVFVIAELGANLALWAWYSARPIRIESVLDRFLVARNLISPFVSDNPVRELSVEYLGHTMNRCAAADFRVADPFTGVQLAANRGIIKGTYLDPESLGWRVTNEQGFAVTQTVDTVYAVPKPANSFRIVVTGGSTTLGDGAETPFDSMPSYLYAFLRDRFAAAQGDDARRLEVINAGGNAYTTEMEFLDIVTRIAEYEPDVVVSYNGAGNILFEENDKGGGGNVAKRLTVVTADYHREILQNARTIGGSLAILKDVAERRVGCFLEELALTYSVRTLSDRAFSRLAGLLPANASSPGNGMPNPQRKIGESVDAYARGLRLLIAASEILDFRLAQVFHPVLLERQKPLAAAEKELLDNMPKAQKSFRHKALPAYRQVFLEVAGAHATSPRLCFADPTDALSQVQFRVYEDGAHMIGAGYRFMAEKIVEALDDCGFLP